MLLCTILQRLHLEADAVGSVSVSKVYLSSFQTLLKHTTLYTCNIMIHLWFFFPLDFFYFFHGRKQFEFDPDKKRVTRLLKTNFWFPC